MGLRDSHRLLAIVAIAVVVRVLTLWLGRAEFTGWFNHTYYYFVQVRGLLEQGSLPYPDMPLLFYLYALVARVLIAFGLGADLAVVASTRLVMCLVPALIPLPAYRVLNNLNRGAPLERAQWALVLASGFLPLTVSYLPEVLQKNMFGLLLLWFLILCSQRLLRRVAATDVVVATALVLAILLAHYGTSAATALYALSLLLAYAMVHRSLRSIVFGGLFLGLGAALAATVIYALDVQRFDRLFVYLRSSISESLLATLLSGEARPGALGTLLTIVALDSVLLAMYAVFLRRGTALPAADRVFWLANIFFSVLLVLPLVDERLMGRLALFLFVPALILVAHLERFAIERSWLKAAGAGAVVLATLLLAVGELASSRIRNAGHQDIQAGLEALAKQQILTPADLVITTTGAEHICNWYFRVKAGVITSLTLDDFAKYRAIYVLNPLPRAPLGSEDVENRTVDNEADRYSFMLRNVPKPAEAEPQVTTEQLELFRLQTPPADWRFDTSGRWQGYRAGAAKTER